LLGNQFVTQSTRSTAAALSRVLGPLRRAVLRSTRTAAELPDLAEPHIEVLRVVAATPGISPHAIAVALKLARPTVSNLIQTMKRADLITIDRNTSDARRVHVSLTETAEQLLARYDAASEEILTAALNELTPAERAAVAAAVPAMSKLQVALAGTDAPSVNQKEASA
jgi:DNA-binding MarR family transcriptional regulator